MSTKKKTTDQFILDAKKVHHDKYSYSNTVYKNSKTKVIITCYVHGDFSQTPNTHLKGGGCRKCGRIICSNKLKSNTIDFIEKSIKKHGTKFDYSQVDYKNNSTKVNIICTICNTNFLQRPNDHLNGDGCPECRINKKKTFEDFIEDAKKVHENKYNYSKVDFINMNTCVIIYCNRHEGYFSQTPQNHLFGGCEKCSYIDRGLKLLKTQKEVIETFIKIHGNFYNYSKVEYVKGTENIIIICPDHGEFTQTPQDHLSGRRCIKCSKKNYSKVAIEWLNYESKNRNCVIQHAENGKEFTIPGTKLKADGYCPETKTVFEFHGDFWHGNPNVYESDYINERTGEKMGDLYTKTIERENKIRELGYKLVVIWELEWKMLRVNTNLVTNGSFN